MVGCIFLRYKEDQGEANKIVDETSSSLPESVYSLGSSVGESAETLRIFLEDVSRKVFRASTGYDPKMKDGSCVEGMIMSIAMLGS